jgi:transposase
VVQRIHAVLFHHGAAYLGEAGISTMEGRDHLEEIAAFQVSAAGQMQITIALHVLETLEQELDTLRRHLVATAKRLRGAKVLHQRLYGVGPITALALTCWLGGDRFSARQAVRFAGLDVTVSSSAGKRAPGHLSRQGPPVLRWCAYEAGKTHARESAPDHVYYAAVKERIDGKRATLSEARKIVRSATHILAELGEEALVLA